MKIFQKADAQKRWLGYPAVMNNGQQSNGKQAVAAIILAGSRPGRDLMAEAAGVPVKALIPVAG